VMAGLVGPMLHPAPKTACVIGLGTGSTAGWLAAVEGMTRVDVAELEPAIIRVAEDCHHVNRDVLHMPNVNLHIGDGRELVMAHDGEPWDVIFSEPSNPYRAGIASLFSQDFYVAAAEKLSDDGVFVQWLQAYEIDPSTVESVYATMASVFPYVETWQGCPNDLLLIASKKPIVHDVARVQARAAQEPYASALARVWGVKGAEGFYSAFLAGDPMARAILAAKPEEISTDDMPRLEFGFARGLGRNAFKLSEAIGLAKRLGTEQPPVPPGSLDGPQLLEARSARMVASYTLGDPPPSDNPIVTRARARSAWLDGRLADAREGWRRAGDVEAVQPLDLLVIGESAAFTGDVEPLTRATGGLRAAGREAEAKLIEARLAAKQDRLDDAVALLAQGFVLARSDPWLVPAMVDRALLLATQLATTPARAAPLWEALKEPFAAHIENDKRLMRRFTLAGALDFATHCVEALEPMEPWVPFTPSFLTDRVRCYQANSHPLLDRALEDVETLVRLGTPEFGGGVGEKTP
jgi:spermidine synthase